MCFLAVQKPAPIVSLVNAHIGVTSYQNNPRSGSHVAVVSDIVVYPVGGLNPAMKNVDKSRQRNVIGRGKNFNGNLLQFHA
jgi:hypothetical protein